MHIFSLCRNGRTTGIRRRPSTPGIWRNGPGQRCPGCVQAASRQCGPRERLLPQRFLLGGLPQQLGHGEGGPECQHFGAGEVLRSPGVERRGLPRDLQSAEETPLGDG